MHAIAERRLRRSERAPLALRFQLEHTLGRGGLEALVVADADGFVVAAAGDSAVCEELAAIAPHVARGHFGMRLPPLVAGGDVAVRRLDVPGASLFLASIGGNVARDALLAASMSGVERILTRN